MFQYDTDIRTIDEGVWVPFDGSSFRIAHISNVKFQRSVARLQQPHRKKIEAGTMDPGQSKELACRALSEAVLLDWKDVINAAGEQVPYTPEHGFEALMKNPEFRDFVSDVAQNAARFREEAVEELGKV
jgi:hypothetical protein